MFFIRILTFLLCAFVLLHECKLLQPRPITGNRVGFSKSTKKGKGSLGVTSQSKIVTKEKIEKIKPTFKSEDAASVFKELGTTTAKDKYNLCKKEWFYERLSVCGNICLQKDELYEEFRAPCKEHVINGQNVMAIECIDCNPKTNEEVIRFLVFHTPKWEHYYTAKADKTGWTVDAIHHKLLNVWINPPKLMRRENIRNQKSYFFQNLRGIQA